MVRIVSRAEWGARPPKSPHRRIELPTSELWLHHTAGRESSGVKGLQQIQNFHMDGRGWKDIAYSFVVNRGVVYEGRGAGIAGAHTSGHNTISHAICVVGNFQTVAPADRDVTAVADLTRHGYLRGWWGRQLSGGHRQVGSTSCPGDRLYVLIPKINKLAVQQSAPPPASEEDVMPITDPTHVKKFQSILARSYPTRPDKGPPYAIGAIDGQIGPKTKAAIEDWQRRRGVTVNGTLDQVTAMDLYQHVILSKMS